MKGKLIKWLIIILLAGVLVGSYEFCSSAKAESEAPVTAEPTPAPTADPNDPWLHWHYPDWATSTFAPEFVSPSPSIDPEILRDMVPDGELTGVTPITSDSFISSLNAYSSFYSNGDTSVIYFRSFLNQQIAISAGNRFGYPWTDSTTFQAYNNGYCDFKSGTTPVQLTAVRTRFDASYGDFNFTFWDKQPRNGGSPLIPGTNKLLYYFALNRTYPKIYNAPAWFSEVGITDDLLYSVQVYPLAVVTLSDQEETPQVITFDPFTLQEFYGGKTFYIDLDSLFAGDQTAVQSVAFNFRLSFISSDILKPYREYLAAHPEITGHVPFYVYFMNDSTSAPFNAMLIRRVTGVSQKEADRTFLQQLFLPDQAAIAEIFNSRVPDLGDNATTSLYTDFRTKLFNLVSSQSGDALLTMPSIDIPMGNNRTVHVADSYTMNFTQTLRDLGLYVPLRFTTTMVITCVFINAVFSMIVTVFDIRWFDGVSGGD